jgi:hypothetical protein
MLLVKGIGMGFVMKESVPETGIKLHLPRTASTVIPCLLCDMGVVGPVGECSNCLHESYDHLDEVL